MQSSSRNSEGLSLAKLRYSMLIPEALSQAGQVAHCFLFPGLGMGIRVENSKDAVEVVLHFTPYIYQRGILFRYSPPAYAILLRQVGRKQRRRQPQMDVHELRA